MALIDIKKLTFRYGEEYLFKNLDLQIDSNWKLGLIGRNGRGKTTFLNILLGNLEYSGSIVTTQQFSYFPLKIEDPSMMTLHIVEALYPMYEYWRLQKELQLLSLDEEVLYRDFSSLSDGEQTKILLAILFLQENHCILIDEPTNHLDIKGRKVVSAYLQKKQGFVLISHDRNFINQCVDHIMAINKTNIDLQSGNFDTWNENKERQNTLERVQNKKLRREIASLEEASRRSRQWSDKVESTKTGSNVSGLRPDRGHIGHMAAKMMQKAKNTERRKEASIQEKKKLLKNIEEAEPLTIHALSYNKKQFIQVNNLRIKQRNICGNIDFVVNQGDKIAIIGKNGSGKSSILKAIVGEIKEYSGNITKGSGLQIAYVKQSIQSLKGSLDRYLDDNDLDSATCKMLLRKLDFSRELFTVPMEKYSDGQKKKVLLASALSRPAHVYIFDEPLNYIDVFTRIQIEDMLEMAEVTMIFVEHDYLFVNKIATKIINLDI